MWSVHAHTQTQVGVSFLNTATRISSKVNCRSAESRRPSERVKEMSGGGFVKLRVASAAVQALSFLTS